MAKTVIYYFSATGNSLAAAQELQASLEDSLLVSIPKATGNEVGEETQMVGIVTPVYHFGLPRIVAEFLNHTLAVFEQAYYFLVLTYGGMAGAAGVQTARILAERGGRLSFCDQVKMVDNYVVRYRIPKEDKQQDLLIAADERLRDIASRISEQEYKPAGTWGSGFLLRYHQKAVSRYPKQDKLFVVEDRCTRCGLCESVCPAQNIRVGEDGVKFLHRCEQCLACLHWCPVSAINVEKKTEGQGRYHHPRVRLSDISRDSHDKEC